MAENNNNEVQDTPKKKETKKTAGKEKVSKGFGNTIILFIVFFIVFTVIVTGVAFFADKVDLSGTGKDRNLEDIAPAEQMTDPKEGESTEYVLGENGEMGRKEVMEPMLEKPEQKEEPAIPMANAAPEKPAPLPPVNIKPEIKKEEPKKKPVEKVSKPEPKPASTREMLATKKTSGDYVVQLASFKNKNYADAEQKKLQKMLPDVFVVRADLGEKGIWYRLRCFNGVSRAEANEKAALIARQTNYKPYPMKK